MFAHPALHRKQAVSYASCPFQETSAPVHLDIKTSIRVGSVAVLGENS